MQQVLVVDDEIGIRELLSEILRDEGYQVRLAENASQARELRGQARPDLVLLDIWMPDTDGITLLKEWAASGMLTMPVVMMSGHGTIETAVEATRIGAFDFLEKPIALQKLLGTVGARSKRGAVEPHAPLSLGSLGRAALITELKQRLERVRSLRSPVLLAAEPGSGAEVCARFLHQPNTPWVAPETHAALADAPFELAEKARDGTLVPARGERSLAHRAERPDAARRQARQVQRAPRLRGVALAAGSGGGRAIRRAPVRRAVRRHDLGAEPAPASRGHSRARQPDARARHRGEGSAGEAIQHRRAQRAAQSRLAGQPGAAGERRAQRRADGA